MTTITSSLTSCYCPHCHMPLTEGDANGRGPSQAMRCPHCRLVVAAMRGIDRARAIEAPATGAAASIVGGAARRAEGRKVEGPELFAALRAAAETLDVSVARMRMIDYDELVREGGAEISVADVLASSRSWKAACREAADTPVEAADSAA